VSRCWKLNVRERDCCRGLHLFHYVKYIALGFEILTGVVTKFTIFWDLAPCSPYVNRRFRGMYHLHLQCRKSAKRETSVQRVSSHLKTGVIRSSERSFHIRTRRHYIAEDSNVHGCNLNKCMYRLVNEIMQYITVFTELITSDDLMHYALQCQSKTPLPLDIA
jgi:hypothetical protein